MRPLPEISFDPGTAISDDHLLSDTPWVARGLVSDWPIVEAAQHSDERAVEYLKTFYSGRPVCAFLGEPKDAGRFFYKEGIDSPNRPIFKYGIAEAEHYHNTIEKFEWVTPMMSETGKKIRISVNTPNYMNPACESYWSM